MPDLQRLPLGPKWALAIFAAAVLSAGLHADETVKLKDGTTRVVKTSWGRPDAFMDDVMEVREWGVAIEPPRVNAPSDFSWHLGVAVVKEGYGLLKVESSAMPSFRYRQLIFAAFSSGHGRTVVGEGFRARVCPRHGNPGSWAWLNEPGDSWIPFECSYSWHPGLDGGWKLEGLPEKSFTQWVHYTEKDKIKLLKAMAKAEADDSKHREIRTVMGPQGQPFACELWDGEPLRKPNDHVVVKSLAPFYTTPKPGESRVLGWKIEAESFQREHLKISLSSPWHPERTPDVVEVEGPKTFRGVFFLKQTSPWMWEWLDQSGDSLVPVRFKMESEALKEPVEWTEWALIPEDAKERVKRLLKDP